MPRPERGEASRGPGIGLRVLYALATRPGVLGASKALWIWARAGSLAAAAPRDAIASPQGGGPSRASLEAQREVKDMGHLWVAFAGGALFLGLATLLGILWGLQTVLGRTPDWPALRASALAHAGDSANVMRFRSRAPGLFPDPPGDLARFRAEQAGQDPGYGWVDRRAGIIRMPVARAMERIATGGWPQWRFPGPATRPRDAAEAATWRENP